MKTITKTKNNVTVTRQVGEYQYRINADGDIVYVSKYKDKTTITIRNNGAVVVVVNSKDIDRNPKNAPNGAVARLGHGKHWAGQATLDTITELLDEVSTYEKPEELVINPAYAHMTTAEIKTAEKNWDNIQNEGYTDGFNPYRDNLWLPKN